MRADDPVLAQRHCGSRSGSLKAGASPADGQPRLTPLWSRHLGTDDRCSCRRQRRRTENRLVTRCPRAVNEIEPLRSLPFALALVRNVQVARREIPSCYRRGPVSRQARREGRGKARDPGRCLRRIRWPRPHGRGRRSSRRVLLASREEASVSVACVAGMLSVSGDFVANVLGDLSPALDVFCGPAYFVRRMKVVLTRKRARDRTCVWWILLFPVPRSAFLCSSLRLPTLAAFSSPCHLSGECGARTQTNSNALCEDRNRQQRQQRPLVHCSPSPR